MILAMLKVMPAAVLRWAMMLFSLAAADIADPDVVDVTPVQSLLVVIVVIVVVLVVAAIAALIALIHRYRKVGEKPDGDWLSRMRKS